MTETPGVNMISLQYISMKVKIYSSILHLFRVYFYWTWTFTSGDTPKFLHRSINSCLVEASSLFCKVVSFEDITEAYCHVACNLTV